MSILINDGICVVFVQVNGSPEDAGIIPRAVTDLFERMDKLRKEGVKASVRASFLEVSVPLKPFLLL